MSRRRSVKFDENQMIRAVFSLQIKDLFENLPADVRVSIGKYKKVAGSPASDFIFFRSTCFRFINDADRLPELIFNLFPGFPVALPGVLSFFKRFPWSKNAENFIHPHACPDCLSYLSVRPLDGLKHPGNLNGFSALWFCESCLYEQYSYVPVNQLGFPLWG